MLKLIILITLALSLLRAGCDEKKQPVITEGAEQFNPVDDRDTYAGIYGIWYGSNEAVLSSQYLKGGQIVVQWKHCEPEEGKYDFSLLEKNLAELTQRGLKATVQINGSLKPDYLFKQVPYLTKKAHPRQVQDSLGSLMYWHPVFIRSYLNFISAYADYLKASPYKNTVVGVRQNWNSFGTEMTEFPGIEDLTESDWVIPPGVFYYKFESAKVNEYKRTIMTQFLNSFTPEITVFIRTNISDELVKEHEDYFNNGLAGWFHTGAGMEQNQSFDQVHRYARFLEYCKPGKTVGFSESNAYLYGDRTRYPYSELQWVYWRMLSELHCGISYIGMRPYAFDRTKEGNKEFENILRFASSYVGFHALPAISPGAWIAFRGKGDNFNGDYTFLIRSLDNSSLTDVRLVGSKDFPYGAWAQRLSENGKIFLNIDDAFFSEEGSERSVSAVIRIIYFDSSIGNWTIKYDSVDNPDKVAMQVTNKDTREWKTLEIPVNDGYFSNRCAAKADIVIENTDAAGLILHMVEIRRQ
jgi:hypothetical protein